MTVNQTLEKIKNKFNVEFVEKGNQKFYFYIQINDLLPVVAYLFNDLDMRFITASAIDTNDGIEVLYHFSDDKNGAVITSSILIADKQNPNINSITSIIKGAGWIEREIHELAGVNFIGNHNLKHLLLSDDWPEGNYPLRHDNE